MQSVRSGPLLSNEDYGAIEAAVMETARGRWFLAEYARRNRNTDTDAVLAAIRRLERLVETAGNFEARDEVTRGMADIAQAIAAAQVAPETPHAFSAPLEPWTEMAEGDLVDDEAGPGESAEAMPVETNDDVHDVVSDTAAAPLAPDTRLPEPDSLPGDVELQSTSVQHEEPGLEEIAIGQPIIAAEATMVSRPEVPEIPENTTQEEIAFEETEAVSERLVEVPASTGLPERDVFSELESFLAEAVPTPARAEATKVVETPSDPEPLAAELPSSAEKPEAADTGPFPILELDEAAAEALLTQDPPRHELILPANHLLTQRWHKDVGHDASVAADATRPAVEEPLRTSLVTFIDEEPVDESDSVFSAPLRLEPEEGAAPDAAVVVEAKEAQATPARPTIVPPITIGEIEAMPFARKAALFS